jgi:hypothetical protein
MPFRVEAVQVPAIVVSILHFTALAAFDKLFNKISKVLRLCVVLQQIAGNISLFGACIFSNSDELATFTLLKYRVLL